MNTSSGRLLTHPAAARQRFIEIAGLSDDRIDLTEASLIVALEEYPALQVARYLDQIDRWSDAIRARVVGSHDIDRIVDEINRLLFDQEGFHGEATDYYDPRSAFLNEVLDRHAGLPLTLSIVYIEVSRRLGIEMSGVALPGRFLVKVAGVWGEILIDPFDEGRVLTTIECQRIMDEVYGGGVKLREHHLRSVARRQVLSHLLAHLKSVYLAREDLEGALASADRLLILDDRDPYEVRDHAHLAMQTHRYEEAIADFERYLELMPHADDREAIREQIAYLRGWLERN